MFCQSEDLWHCFPSSVRRILEELPENLDETHDRSVVDSEQILREIRSRTKVMIINCCSVS